MRSTDLVCPSRYLQSRFDHVPIFVNTIVHNNINIVMYTRTHTYFIVCVHRVNLSVSYICGGKLYKCNVYVSSHRVSIIKNISTLKMGYARIAGAMRGSFVSQGYRW